LLGVAGVLLGLGIATFLAISKFYYGVSIMVQHGPLMLLGVGVFISGVQLVSMGLLGEIIARTYYESQNKPIYSLREVKSHRKEMSDPAEPARPSGSSER
jgi:ABC-type Co2+ transport system permease subunit